MNVNHGKIVNEIFKILKGLGFSVELYNEEGDGPMSSPHISKYIWAKPDGIMFDMPTDDSTDTQEIIIYKPDSLDIEIFKNIHTRVKNVGRLHGIEITVRNFNKSITPKDFSYRAKATKEEELENLKEHLGLPNLKDYLK